MSTGERIVIYQSPQEFLEDNLEVLMKREEVSQLLYYTAYRESQRKQPGKGVFGKVGELLFGCVEDRKLQCYLPERVQDERLDKWTKKLAVWLKEERVQIQGLNANDWVGLHFLKNYCTEEKQYEKVLSMDVMKLMQIRDVSREEMRESSNARLEDEDVLVQWFLAFHEEALHSPLKEQEARLRVRAMICAKMLYVLRKSNQKPLSMAAVTRRLPHGAALNYVYTPQNERGKGYAIEGVYQLSKYCLEEGAKYCTLFVDKKNPISNCVYRKIGYEVVEDCSEYVICN